MNTKNNEDILIQYWPNSDHTEELVALLKQALAEIAELREELKTLKPTIQYIYPTTPQLTWTGVTTATYNNTGLQ